MGVFFPFHQFRDDYTWLFVSSNKSSAFPASLHIAKQSDVAGQAQFSAVSWTSTLHRWRPIKSVLVAYNSLIKDAWAALSSRWKEWGDG